MIVDVKYWSFLSSFFLIFVDQYFRNQLKESLQGFTEISKVSNQQTQQIQDLKEQLSIVTVEKNKLKTQEEENIKNKSAS